MRLSAKMIVFNILAKGLILLGFLMAGPYLFNYFALNYTDERLGEMKDQVLLIIEEDGIEKFFQEDSEGFGSYNLLKEEYISFEKLSTSEETDTIVTEYREIENEVVLYRVLSYVFEEDGHQYLLEIGRSLETINKIESLIYNFLILAFVSFVVLSAIFDGIFHKTLLLPFKQIIQEKLPGIHEPSSYSFKPIKTNTYDFKVLDEAIDNLMTRIQQAFNREREFIAHASHELITPISILQSKIENALSESDIKDHEITRLMDMLKTIQRFKHLVQSLLFISKIGNAQFLRNEQVDLRNIVTQLDEEWKPVAIEKEINFEVRTDTLPMVIDQSNQSLVLVMIQNAVTNAIRYTPANGSIRIVAFKTENGYVVEVKDTGPGIQEGLLQQIKEGQVFLKDARNEKSGYGLQILYKIARYLKVNIFLVSGANGTTIKFTFPSHSVYTSQS